MNSPIISGVCEGLDANDVKRVQLFMKAVIRAFADGDPVALQALDHPGGDPRDEKNSFDFNKSLMDGGDKVKSWSARPYSEPQWDIMKMLRHHPTPTIWIDVTLSDGQRDYPFCYACAPDKDGKLKGCYYVDR